MALKDYIGKAVISAETKRRYRISEITAPEIIVRTEDKNRYGTYSHYCFETINGDPFSNGHLFFEDSSLKEPFIKDFEAYSRSKDGRLETYGYWLMKE